MAEPAGPPPLRSGVTVAAFDFDGTLASRGSVIPFLIAVRGLFPVAAAVVRMSPKLVKGAVLGGRAADLGKEALFTRLLGGVPVQRVDRVATVFAERHMRRRRRPEVIARLEWHRDRGDYIVIVSASPESYVARAGEILKVDGVLATRLATSGGLLTGRYEGTNCRGPEKFIRINQWLRTNEIAGSGSPQPVIWAYGNSRGDLRLLEAADHGVDVSRLGALGRLRAFPRLASLRASERRGVGAESPGGPKTAHPSR
jgi:phosphatidylglycerophosphatase C